MRIREGDPLEIFTDREGEVIFKKYSPIGELSDFAASYAETLHKTCGLTIAICDKDGVIACAGLPRKDYLDHKISARFEQILESRSLYAGGEDEVKITDSGDAVVSCAMPVIADGDIVGCVAAIKTDGALDRDTEIKLIETAAGFLGKQFES